MCLVGVRSPGFPVFWLVRYLGVRIFGLFCLGVRNFGFAVFWLAGYLGVRIPGCFGFFSTLGSPALCVDVYCGSYGSSVFSRVAWHAGSCFSAVYDASTRLGHSNECSLYAS